MLTRINGGLNTTGFDIVIGNPPYGAKLAYLDLLFIKSKYKTARTINGVQKASLDTFTLFIEVGHCLINKGGNLHLISSNMHYLSATISILAKNKYLNSYGSIFLLMRFISIRIT